MGKAETFGDVAKSIERLSGGRVDILINNAAVMIGTGRSFVDGPSKSTLAEWDETFRVNLFGPVFFTNALIPQLLSGEEKKVVNLSSLGADRAKHEELVVQLASYSASKAALATATLNFQLEFKDRGLIFVSLSPGGAKTDMDDFGIAPMTASESVGHCISFVSRMTIEDGGQLRNYDGSKSIVADKPR
ncbi:hypothetical protein J3R82DRAFT_3544 [Butyriboletus roseoflavus]|nr:hypothetical protein J3R82DRAFT_3544 [Butyriboletus roseoflavus]